MTLEHPKVKRLLEALRHGDFVDDACEYAAISEQTYYRWLREGFDLARRVDEGETLTPAETELQKLCESIKEAELLGQHAALTVIQRAANNGTWQAAAWFLERRNKKWSNRTEVTGPDGGPIQTVTVEDVDEKIRNLIAASEADRGSVEKPSRTQ
jgi:predicted mannosyl-3-phosphoglycerate phosphatase (HAD superfamily)